MPEFVWIAIFVSFGLYVLETGYREIRNGPVLNIIGFVFFISFGTANLCQSTYNMFFKENTVEVRN